MNPDNNSFIYGENNISRENPAVRDGGENNHNPKSRTILAIILSIAIVILVFVIFSLVNSGYTVKNIIVNGSSPYTRDELVALVDSYCEEKNTRSFFSVNAKELAEKFHKTMPYIRSIEIEKKFPDTVVLNIEGEEAEYIFSAHKSYYVLNSDLKVLEILEGVPENTGLVVVSFPTPKEVSLGKVIVFEEDSLMDAESFLKLSTALKKTNLRADVKILGAENKFELRMTLRSGIDVYMGSIKDIEEKISGMKKWLDENPDEISDKLNMDISILKKIVITRD